MSQQKGWMSPPSVMVVSGDLEFTRNREILRAQTAARLQGRQVVHIPAGDGHGLSDALSGGFLFDSATLVIVQSANVKKSKKKKASEDEGETLSGGWTEEDLEIVLAHAKETQTEVSLVVYHEGVAGESTFAGMVAAALPKGRVLNFPAPKPWEMKDYALKFFRGEVTRLGKTIPEPLAEVVLRAAGTDLGLLSFEALKLSKLLDSKGTDTVQPSDLAGLVSNFGAEDWDALKAYLSSRNSKGVVQSLQTLRGGAGGDSVVKALYILQRTIEQWLFGSALLKSGADSAEASARMQMKEYTFQKSVVPATRQWTTQELTTLYRSVVAVEGGVRRGHLNPWVALESALVSACTRAG